MAEFKVIFRDDRPDWQEGCPVLIEAIQVARNTRTSEAYLQLKVRNLSASKIGVLGIEATVVATDGEEETVQFECLDADIGLNALYRPSAVKLSHSEIRSATARVTRVDDRHAFQEAIRVPEALALTLSEVALEERNIRLSSMNHRLRSSFQHVRKDDWWICTCGALNCERETCRVCGLEEAKLANLENETLLEMQARERKYQDAHKALSSESVSELEESRKAFEELGAYKDSAELMMNCSELIAEIEAKRARKKKTAVTVVLVAAAVTLAIYLAVTFLIPSILINGAIKRAEGGDYDGALVALDTGMIPESARNDAIKQVHRLWGDRLFEEEKYDGALGEYDKAENDDGRLKCGVKYTELGRFSDAIQVLQPLSSRNHEGADSALDEAKYGYVTANLNNTDKSTCTYLDDLKNKGYKDAQELDNKLYALSATSRGFDLRLTAHLTKYSTSKGYYIFKFTINGTKPVSSLEKRSVSVYDSLSNKTHKHTLSSGADGGFTTYGIPLDASGTSVRITDDSTGAVLLEESVSF